MATRLRASPAGVSRDRTPSWDRYPVPAVGSPQTGATDGRRPKRKAARSFLCGPGADYCEGAWRRSAPRLVSAVSGPRKCYDFVVELRWAVGETVDIPSAFDQVMRLAATTLPLLVLVTIEQPSGKTLRSPCRVLLDVPLVDLHIVLRTRPTQVESWIGSRLGLIGFSVHQNSVVIRSKKRSELAQLRRSPATGSDRPLASPIRVVTGFTRQAPIDGSGQFQRFRYRTRWHPRSHSSSWNSR